MEVLQYRNKSWLQKQFDTYKTVTAVSNMTGYPRTCITRYAKKFGIYTSKYNRSKNNTIDEDYFKDIDSQEKAYWLGFIMADGNIYPFKNNDKIQFSIKLKHSDINHLRKFKKAIKFTGKLIERDSIRNNTKLRSCEIKIYDKQFCINLINVGVLPQKTGTEHIPDCVKEKYYIDFIRGFIDGDGTITGSMIKKHTLKVSLCSTSILIINQIKEFIYNQLNIKMHINLYRTMYTLSCTKKSDNYKLLNTLYYDGCTSLDRKYNLALLSLLQYENLDILK